MGQRVQGLFDVLMDSMSVNVVLYRAIGDGEDFEIIAFNKAAERTEEIKKDELIGKRLKEVFPGVDESGLLDVLRRVYHTGIPEVLDEQYYSDDRIKGWRSHEVKRLPDGTVIVFYQDVSELKSYQDDLSSLGQVIDSSLNEIYIFDLESFLFTYVNKGAQLNIGYSLDELLEMAPYDIKPEFDKQRCRDLITPLMSGQEERLSFETFHQRKDGSIYRIEASLQAIKKDGADQIVVMIIDITQRQALQDELLAQKEVYERLFHGSSDGVALLEAGRFIDCNEALLRMLGCQTKEELMGCSPDEFSPEYQPDGVRSSSKVQKIAEGLSRGGTSHFEWMHLKTDGSLLWCDVLLTPITIDGKDIIYSVTRDISDRKAMERELVSLTKGLQERVEEEVQKNRLQSIHMFQQSRLAQMGEMISMIAHQWRQPLASISAISGTLRMDVLIDAYDKSFFVERLGSITELSQHLSTTIDDFREFFKMEKELKEMTLDAMVKETLHIIGPTLYTRDITVVEEVEEDVVVLTYPNEVRQVLLNLLKNAEDALIEHQVEDAKIIIRGHKKAEMVILQVEDNAGGIPEEIMDRVFEPYFTTKETKDGTGLGLYMSKTIIEEYCDGSLDSINTDRGVRFEIVLPLSGI